MAFFGLTALGPQSCFQASALDYLDITLFDDASFVTAFKRCDKDGSGAITVDEFEALLTDVYHGPPPKTEVTRLMTHFDANKDGKVTMDEFVEGVKQLKAELEEHAAARSVGATEISGRVSLSELQLARQRHQREFEGPRETLHHPVVASQEVGWTAKDGLVKHERFPKVHCEVTRFAEKLFASGEYFV